MNELIDKQIRKAKEDNRTIDRDQAYEEVVADSMETMLSSGRILQALADIRKQDRSLAEKIRTWFETFTEKLKSIVSTYKNIKPDSVEGRLVADMKDVISTFEALYGDALLDASENFDAEAQKNTAVGGVKYSIREDIVDVHGKEYNCVVELDKTVSKRTLSEPKKFLNYIVKNLVGLKVPVDDGDGNTELIEFASINETVTKNRKRHPVLGELAYTKGDTRKQVIVNAAEVIKVSSYDPKYSSADNEHGWLDQNGWESRKTYVLTQDGMIYEAYLKIAKTRDGRNILYAVNLNINEGIAVDQGATSRKAAVLAAMPSSGMVAHDSADVNNKFSGRDSAGMQLSGEQQKYFKDSQCRDTEGNLLVLYHQTDSDFTVFDTRKQGAGRNDSDTPFGIFLKRSDKDIGLTGKKQMALYANITNPLRAENREDLVKQLRGISEKYAAISDKHEQLDTEYQRKIDQAKVAWNDYVKEWREKNPNAKRTALYEDPQFNELFDAEDVLADEWASKSDQLSMQAKEIITEDLRKAGYDGIFLEKDSGSWGRSTDAIIALDANQVKNVDNRNPTDNPDIRYSSRDTTQQKIREELEQENAKLKEDVSRLEELVKLQRTGTGGTKFTKTSVENAARMLKKYANVKRMASTEELTKLLHTFYESVASSEELSWDQVNEWAQPLFG